MADIGTPTAIAVSTGVIAVTGHVLGVPLTVWVAACAGAAYVVSRQEATKGRLRTVARAASSFLLSAGSGVLAAQTFGQVTDAWLEGQLGAKLPDDGVSISLAMLVSVGGQALAPMALALIRKTLRLPEPPQGGANP